MFLFFSQHELILLLLFFNLCHCFALMGSAAMHAEFDAITRLELLACIVQLMVVTLVLFSDDGILGNGFGRLFGLIKDG